MTDGPWHRRHPIAVDVAFAVTFVLLDTGVTLVGGSWWPRHPGPLAWALLGGQAVACASLALRRVVPITVVGVLGAFTLVLTLLITPGGALTPAHPGTMWAPASTVPAAYAPLYHRRHRAAAFATLAVCTLVVMRPWDPSVSVMTVGLLRTALGPLLALYFDARRRLVQALVERAERAERERHLLAEQARAEERARLAGEMHDVVTHRVSLMVLQAGALRVTAGDEATRQAAEELRAAGCQALDELRDLVGILRAAPDGDRTPSVAGFADLVAESAAVGVPTELTEVGDPALASPVVGRTAYRVLREALTNVRKHAPGARVTVRVEYDPARIRLTVRNTAPTGGPGALAGTGSGLGLAHLRHRIELLHGTLRAGPGPDGGFRVEATLPAYVPTVEPVG
ncbi:sensor histidine kinase [Streptantibioticus cattleyicolor]|uniref:histidine kinase n=1 Tax=Streptantibioticus cattleyicolor (strain ATCC 35852 / DSM 46488 / JCM 4925 / NBRC 14057 / NRRL 8057) TaxID=1003195 RepID=F8JMM0_STREN|nr:histidine kinase [Streptantibioticus cattleyicolor]AEW98921.1 two-component system sensor kinase [Streptantibioticus cattleyicolor NRRL 8057 = DSM 46488]CCB72033.1 Two-component system sensor kinase [Streptantibioticus cattleyicolor NRRL 8057 = DSM 46488]